MQPIPKLVIPTETTGLPPPQPSTTIPDFVDKFLNQYFEAFDKKQILPEVYIKTSVFRLSFDERVLRF